MDDIDDIDYDFLSDPIKKFLQHKLKEMRLNNAEIEKQIHNRREMANARIEDGASKFSDRLVEITDTWSNSFDDKWVIGVMLKTTNNRTLIEIQPVIQWNHATPILYSTRIFNRFRIQQDEKTPKQPKNKKVDQLLKLLECKPEMPQHLENEWVVSDKITECGCVVLSFDTPAFTDAREYAISGILSYTCNSTQYHLTLPNFKISVDNFINNSTEVKAVDLLSGEDRSFLSALTVNEKHALIAKISSTTFKTLEYQLEFECLFTRIPVVSRAKFFFVKDISTRMNGSVVKLENEDNEKGLYRMDIYTRNETTLGLLLHYLHQHIPGIIILSYIFKHQLYDIENSTQVDEQEQQRLEKLSRKFGASLESQLATVEHFCSKRLHELEEDALKSDTVDLDINVNDYKNFRKKLAEYEFESDKLFYEIKENSSIEEDIALE